METPYPRRHALCAKVRVVKKFNCLLKGRVANLILGLSLCCSIMLPQSDRSTITGGAAVPGAPIQARNVDTGAVYEASRLAKLPGFKRSVRQNIVVPIAGTVFDSVTGSSEAPKLRTESSELRDNVSIEQLDELPVLLIGAEASTPGLGNVYSLWELTSGTSTSGTSWTPYSSARVNGMSGSAPGRSSQEVSPE
jgi:hypothetical protein